MKFILALITLCLFGFSLAVAQQTPPPSSGPVGPVGPVVADDPPPPAKAPAPRRTTSRPPRTARPGELIALLPPSVSPLPSFDQWYTFTSSGGGFTIKFPAKPASTPGAAPPEAPWMTQYRTSLSAGGNRSFEANYFDFHGELNAPDLALEGSIAGMVNILTSRGMEVIDRRSSAIGNCQSKEVTLQSKADAVSRARVHMRVLYSGDKVYALLAQTGLAAGDVSAADQFLDSFAVTGGCTAAIGNAAPPKITTGRLEGDVDLASGWQRFDTSHGLSFLLPTSAATREIEKSLPGKTYRTSVYRSAVNGVSFVVAVSDTLPMAPARNGLRENTMIDTMLYDLKQNMANEGLVFGECNPSPLGNVPGRECGVANTATGIKGQARIFVTPQWTFFLMALRETETTDQTVEDRFFSSIKIDLK